MRSEPQSRHVPKNPRMNALMLSPVQARVLAALAEKSITTPAYYPMTVNALLAACNQKTSRDPVMTLTEGEVGHALATLEQDGLVRRDDSSSRAVKWRQQFQHHLLLKTPAFAVLLALVLRGAQTPAELKANASVLGGPDDAAAFNAVLADLADRAQPLVAQLPRAPGQSTARLAHTLCGVPAEAEVPQPMAAESTAPAGSDRVAALEARIAALESQLAALAERLSAAGA